MNKSFLRPVSDILLWSLLSIAALTWIAERFAPTEWSPVLHAIVLIALLLGIPFGFIALRRPRDIRPTSDREIDEAIDQVFDEQSRRNGKT